jgi:asparagine synthase (glutamine-hydrolysing)
MCGICGYVGIDEDGLLERMAAALVHRGPDGEGFFRDGDAGLGHRRLSIIDVAGGAQPIHNEDESTVIICNGEIYNHEELRRDLEAKGHRFRTHSDNEVVLHLWEEHGPDCLPKLNGMFALAIWDRRRRRLFLARDRLGIKPLYFVERGSTLLFASEIKALLAWRGGSFTPNPKAIHEYLALRYVPGPESMFREVRKLPAGHYAVVEEGGGAAVKRWWDPPLHEGPFEGSEEDWLEGFAERFERSISRRLMSEVPFGAYLSGGLDSGTIVGAMSKVVSTPVRTFSVGFDYEHDELEGAAEVAKRFGCDHTEIACRLSDLERLPEMVWHLDEPVGDPIIIPMYMLAREAKKKVTVILAGEGADETLGGYVFHKALMTANRISRLLPGWLHRAPLGAGIRLAPPSLLDRAFDYPASLGNRGKQKILDFVGLMEPRHLPEAWRHLISLFDARDLHGLYTGDFEQALATAGRNGRPRAADSNAPYLNRVIDLQFDHWLPDDILTKQDKLSMASAIEVRVPFLDHELVEYNLRVPPSLKIRRGVTKYLLRRYAERLLPQHAAHRKKMPFYAPVEKFFEQPGFQEMMHDTLSEASVSRRGVFRPEAVGRLRDSLDAGEFVHVKQAFSLIVLELWFRTLGDSNLASGFSGFRNRPC